jgi:FKBP-type peptidyl-prolyl cis-trans isomerase FklB
MKPSLILGMLLTLSPLTSLADETAKMDAMDQINYSVGHQIGTDFKNQHVEMRDEMLIRGIRDAIQANTPPMTKGEMRAVLLDLKKMVLAGAQADLERYRGEGREFLAANAKKEGVVTLPSGLQYKVITSGTGKSPGLDDQVTVNYIGTRLDGAEFDSSARHGKPATFPVKGLIKGWIEALQLMKEGDKWQLFIPSDLGYGERGPLADQTLLFEIELLDINKS